MLNSRVDTCVTLPRLNNERSHQARVRSFNDEGASHSSEPVSGAPAAGPEVASGRPERRETGSHCPAYARVSVAYRIGTGRFSGLSWSGTKP